jgi:hypothetical protein
LDLSGCAEALHAHVQVETSVDTDEDEEKPTVRVSYRIASHRSAPKDRLAIIYTTVSAKN